MKDLTLKLAKLLALTSAARASEILSWYSELINHSSGYTFHSGINIKTCKRSKPTNFIFLTKMEVWNAKTYTGHSTRKVSSSKAEDAGVPAREILKRGFWLKESTFEKFYQKGINTEDPHFQLSILKSLKRGHLNNYFCFQDW